MQFNMAKSHVKREKLRLKLASRNETAYLWQTPALAFSCGKYRKYLNWTKTSAWDEMSVGQKQLKIGWQKSEIIEEK